MSIFSKMSKSFELVASDVKSTDTEIDELIHYSKIDVPLEYIENVKEKKQNVSFTGNSGVN